MLRNQGSVKSKVVSKGFGIEEETFGEGSVYFWNAYISKYFGL
jgi:hypothetical protein